MDWKNRLGFVGLIVGVFVGVFAAAHIGPAQIHSGSWRFVVQIVVAFAIGTACVTLSERLGLLIDRRAKASK